MRDWGATVEKLGMSTRMRVSEAIAVDRQADARWATTLVEPLNGLLALAELLEKQSLSPAARMQVHGLLENGRRMARVLAAAQGATGSIDLAPVALRELVDDLDSAWKSEADKRAYVLAVCQVSAGLRVMIDPLSLRQLFNAMVEEALDARAWGMVELQVEAEAASDGLAAVRVRLQAAGCIDGFEAIRQRCDGLLHRMGGHLQRSDPTGSGLDLCVEFHAAVAESEPIAPIAEEPADSPLAHTHLLIVDDNATNRIVAAALCEMFGCSVETAEDGVEALDAVRDRPFDLILMDIKMPRMDGLEATRAIRAMAGAIGLTPIVALTANGDPDAVAVYLASGMQAVVEKPIKPDQLLNTLQWVLEGGGAQQGQDRKSSAA
jgi:CheY-like chemotaxis protein